jgi:hypothetical protein
VVHPERPIPSVHHANQTEATRLLAFQYCGDDGRHPERHQRFKMVVVETPSDVRQALWLAASKLPRYKLGKAFPFRPRERPVDEPTGKAGDK